MTTHDERLTHLILVVAVVAVVAMLASWALTFAGQHLVASAFATVGLVTGLVSIQRLRK